MMQEILKKIKTKIKQNKLEFIVLTDLLKTWSPEGIESIKDSKRPNSIDWDIFLQLVDRHRIWPIIYHVLNGQKSLDVPKNILCKLQQLNQKNIFSALKHCAETSIITNSFMQAGIFSVSLKGPALAQKTYGDFSLRHSKDIDILVPADQLEKADFILKNLGYVSTEFNFKDMSPLQKELLLKGMHHINYEHPQKSVLLEIHYQLLSMPFCKLIERPVSLNTIDTIRIGGAKIPILEKTHEFIYLCVHGSIHGWSRLKWVYDIFLLMKSFKAEDWKEIHQQAAETKVLHLVLLGTILVSGIFDVSFPCELKATSIKKRTLKSLINKVLQAVEMDNYVVRKHFTKAYFLQKRIHNATNPIFRHKLQYFLSHFQPNSSTVIRWKIPDTFSAIYYLLRPIDFFLRLFARER
jgi:hypothetical protein